MQTRFGKKSLLFLPLTVMALTSCGKAVSQQADIVVSFYPLEYLATRLAGGKLTVATLVPPGSEPHDFELRTSDVMTLYDAKAVFLNGLNMEPFGSTIMENEALSGKTTIFADNIENLIEVTSEKGGTYVDPHFWLDTDIYRTMGEVMLEKLILVAPKYKTVFQENYLSLCDDLAELKAYGLGREIEGKTIAVSHDAFRYMGREFGFEEVYINGFSPDDEPSAAALAALLDVIEKKGIDTIFFEELENQDIATYIAEQTGAKVEVLSPLEICEEGEDYISTYRSNIDKIAEAKSR